MTLSTVRTACFAVPVASPRPRLQARKTVGILKIQCNTLWQLQPDNKWCKKPENEKFAKLLSKVDLTGPIGTKRVCSLASHDYESQEAQDICILEHGAIHLVFDATSESLSSPLDSPSQLYVTDVDSKCDVFVDGQKLEKGQRTHLKPGATICMGQEAQYKVERNVFAHA